MIYKINGSNGEPVYFDGIADPNAKFNAEELLSKVKTEVLEREAVRFSICATFIDGNNTTWREVRDSDPEDTICQVFDTFTGSYTEVPNKTEAYTLNEQKKQNFLASIQLDKVYEIDSIPVVQQPDIDGVDSLPNV